MEYIIGLESGGTKSELAAYDLEENLIFEKSGGYGNPSVNVEQTIDNISNLIEDCLENLKTEKCIYLAVGMAGADTGDFKEILHNHIKRKFCIDNVILNDAEITVKAYLKNEDGIIAIAGTGSSVYVQRNNEGKVIGGWGHILGDKGSGYHTVIEALKRMAAQIDNSLELDELSTEIVKEILGRSTNSKKEITEIVPRVVKKFVYDNPKKAVASLFPIIVNLADKGNYVAVKLLQDAGVYLAETTLAAINEFNGDEVIKIGLKGGVFHNSNVVLESYKSEVSKYRTNCLFISKDMTVTKAVCNLYQTGR
jgi:N-acetylglucosamine kinase-like BadF-type ATPase